LNTSEFTVRAAETADDCTRLEALYDAVFAPEEVAKLASTLFHHHPQIKPKHWLMAEHSQTGELAAASVFIPWQWTWFGKSINVAEQGIVATSSKFHGKGLQRLLNSAFDQKLQEEKCDLAIIQGIPGFYHNFGYYYSLPIDNRIDVQWADIPIVENPEITFRLATENDIPFLMEQDHHTASKFDSANVRDEATWRYLLNQSRQTEYGSDFWIGEASEEASFYCRRCFTGFGEGLIVGEASEQISYDHAIELLNFLKIQNKAHRKPFLRLNLANNATLSEVAIQLGTPVGQPYGFQIKIPNIENWLKTQQPLFTQRLSQSEFKKFTGIFRLNFFKFNIDVLFNNGSCTDVCTASDETDPAAGCCIPLDLAPALLLGRHSPSELRQTRPDIFAHGERSKQLMDILFPAVSSWHHIPY
jgi:predicted N-acetyltransferase YhbS